MEPFTVLDKKNIKNNSRKRLIHVKFLYLMLATINS